MSEKTTSKNTHDEHHDHSFPDWVTLGHTDNPVEAFIKIFAWLVFWTILEVLAIVQEFESFILNMIILFGIAIIKCWFICSFFMHMTWDPPLVSRTAAVPLFFLAVLFLAVGLTTPGAVDDLATICGF
jgi:caa(3)-type oxidase subunit IV